MDRRRYFALVGVGVATIAGCGKNTRSGPTGTTSEVASPSETPPSSASVTTTPEGTRLVPMGQSTSNDGTRMTVTNPRIRKAIATHGVHTRLVTYEMATDDSGPGDGQFLVVDILIDGEPAEDLDSLELRPNIERERISLDGPISVAGGEGIYAFPLPAEAPDQATLQWRTQEETTSWILPESVRWSLGREPSFRIDDIAVIRKDGDLVLELTVTNEGDRDGTFIARVSQEGFSGGDIVTFRVPREETTTHTDHPAVITYMENAGGGTLTIQYPGNSGLRTIEHAVSDIGATTESDS